MLIPIIIGVMGLFVGSFLNVVVLRLHAGRDFVKGRSECPDCKHELAPLDLIPLFSWIALRGRCRYCRKAISPQYPLVELLTALVFFLTATTHQPSDLRSWVVLLLWLYIAGSLVVLAVYDLKWYLLPDKVLLPLILPAVAILALNAMTSHSWTPLLNPLLAALAFGGAFYALAAISGGKWMGGGDVKLAFIMGLLLGLQKTTLAMLIAFNSAAVVGILLIAAHRKSRKDLIPFGPFLILGTLVAFWFGGGIIHWYLNVAGLNLLY